MILTLGLNNALQKVLLFDNLKIAEVNRAKLLLETASGKGINVARTLTTLGVAPMVTGFVGGNTGKLILTHLKKENINSDFVMTKSNTRTCITLINSKTRTYTELIEPSSKIKRDEIAKFYKKIKSKKSEIITISGTLPPQVSDDTYYNILKMTDKHGTLSLIDIWGIPLLKAIMAKPFLIKMNLQEFKSTFKPVNTKKQILDLLHRGIKWIVITMGKNGAVIGADKSVYKVTSAEVKPVNAIGAGDAMLAGFLYAIYKKYDKICTMKFATATAVASTLTLLPALCFKKDVKRIVNKIEVKEI